jgi:hypothetical protein
MNAPTAATGRAHTATALATTQRQADPLRARLVRARFEALAEWGMALEDAGAIAQEVDVDIIEVVELLRHGCPPEFVLSILA